MEMLTCLTLKNVEVGNHKMANHPRGGVTWVRENNEQTQLYCHYSQPDKNQNRFCCQYSIFNIMQNRMPPNITNCFGHPVCIQTV